MLTRTVWCDRTLWRWGLVLVLPLLLLALGASPTEAATDVDDTLAPGDAGNDVAGQDGIDGVASAQRAGVSQQRSGRPPAAPSLLGPVGLFRVSTAELTVPRELRLGLHGEYFWSSGLLVQGDNTERLQGAFTLGFSPHPRVEVFAGIFNSVTENERVREPGSRDPEVIKAFGDIALGSKGVWPLTRDVAVGGELGLKLLSAVSGLTLSTSSTSMWLGPIATFDARRMFRLPLRVHANASYYLDRSGHLYNFHGETLQTREVTSFAYGIAKNRLGAAVAVDAVFSGLWRGTSLMPFAEYQLALVTEDGDPAFAEYTAAICVPPNLPGAACADNRDMQFVTLGLRAALPREVLAFVGVDVRVRSVGYPYGPPLPPLNVVFGLALPVDLDRVTHPPAVAHVGPREPSSPTGNLIGVVRAADDGAPVAGATVVVTGRPRARAATDKDGSFETVSLPTGTVRLEVSAPGFAPTTRDADVRPIGPSGIGPAVEITLQRKPAAATLKGRVSGLRDEPLAGATVKLTGASDLEARTDAEGRFAATITPGAYVVRADAPGFASKETSVAFCAGDQPGDVDLSLSPAAAAGAVPTGNGTAAGSSTPASLTPATPGTAVSPVSSRSSAGQGRAPELVDGTIRLPRAVRFKGATALIAPESNPVLDGVARLLSAHPEVARVHIDAHWDSSLPKDAASTLTREQADAVRAALVTRGVSAERLVSAGLGSTKPLVPNLTPANRARNRRVELRVE